MRKMFSYAFAGLVAASFSQIAFSQSVGIDTKTGDTTVSPNTNVNPQIGSGNQSGQTIGNDNQTSNTQQSGEQNQNTTQRGSS